MRTMQAEVHAVHAHHAGRQAGCLLAVRCLAQIIRQMVFWTRIRTSEGCTSTGCAALQCWTEPTNQRL